jgi:hypothetical protein
MTQPNLVSKGIVMDYQTTRDCNFMLSRAGTNESGLWRPSHPSVNANPLPNSGKSTILFSDECRLPHCINSASPEMAIV